MSDSVPTIQRVIAEFLRALLMGFADRALLGRRSQAPLETATEG
jgi:hypothetical protein